MTDVKINAPVLIQFRKSSVFFSVVFFFFWHRTCQGSTWKEEKRNDQ